MNKKIRVKLSTAQQRNASECGHVDLTEAQALSVRGRITAQQRRPHWQIPEGTAMCPCGQCGMTLERALKRHPARIRYVTERQTRDQRPTP